MEVYQLTRPGAGRDLLRQNVPGLIEAVGTQQFEEQLFRVAERSLCCEHFSVFAGADAQRPQILLAANQGTAELARNVGRLYAGRYWSDDPTNQIALATNETGNGLLVRYSDRERRSLLYRRNCYNAPDWQATGQHLIHKVSLIRRCGRQTLTVNFYRHAKTGPFNDDDVQTIMNSSDLMFALLDRHAASSFAADAATLRHQFEDCLARKSFGLSRREVEVAAAIAAGLNSEAIAQTLDIGINTVLTYRKRAYRQLGISSQNELTRLVYSMGTGRS